MAPHAKKGTGASALPRPRSAGPCPSTTPSMTSCLLYPNHCPWPLPITAALHLSKWERTCPSASSVAEHCIPQHHIVFGFGSGGALAHASFANGVAHWVSQHHGFHGWLPNCRAPQQAQHPIASLRPVRPQPIPSPCPQCTPCNPFDRVPTWASRPGRAPWERSVVRGKPLAL